MEQEWDIPLTASGDASRSILRLGLPRAISKPLMEQGFWRARMTMSEEGIFIRPYKAERTSRRSAEVEIPETWSS